MHVEVQKQDNVYHRDAQYHIRQNFIHILHPSSFRCDAAHTIDDGRARLINVALTYRMIELKEAWGNAKKLYILSDTVGIAMSWMVRLDGLRAAECRFSLQSLRGSVMHPIWNRVTPR